MKTLKVLYFASLREQAGIPGETLQSTADTPAALYQELQARHGFQLPVTQLRFAVNEEYIDADTPLQEGMELLLIPPVAGG